MSNPHRLKLSENARNQLSKQELFQLENFPGQEFVCVSSTMSVGSYIGLEGDVVDWDCVGSLLGTDKPFIQTDIGEIASTLIWAVRRFDLPELVNLRVERPADKLACPTCKTTGWMDWPDGRGEQRVCWRCRGLGWEYNTHGCTECDGRSNIEKGGSGGKSCEHCRGYGFIWDSEEE